MKDTPDLSTEVTDPVVVEVEKPEAPIVKEESFVTSEAIAGSSELEGVTKDPVPPVVISKKEPSANGVKQTPSLMMLDEEEEVKEEVKEEVLKDTPFEEAELLKAWDEFFEKEKDSLAGIETMILKNKPVLRENHVLELSINNGVEINILKKMEENLLGYLRNTLNNTEISISHVIKEAKEGENLYTDLDKFNDMARRNPILRQLKDRLGLDTDY